MAKRRVGVINRPIPGWYPREMYGGRRNQPGVAGKVTYAELYNSSKTGGLIYVWGLSVAGAAIDEYVPEWYYGTFQTSAGSNNPLYSGGPAGYGVVGGFNNATCVGIEIGDFLTTANNDQQWPHDFPMAIIAPGYSFGVHTAGAGAYLIAGIWWQESREY